MKTKDRIKITNSLIFTPTEKEVNVWGRSIAEVFPPKIYSKTSNNQESIYQLRIQDLQEYESSFFRGLASIAAEHKVQEDKKSYCIVPVPEIPNSDVGLRALFNYKLAVNEKGLESLTRIKEVNQYALEDLMDIALLEKKLNDSGERYKNPLDSTEKKFNYPLFYKFNGENFSTENISSINVDKLVHSFVSRLSTMKDNLYYVVSNFYGLKSNQGINEKENFQEQLKETNPELRKYLRKKFCFSNIQNEISILRNSSIHGVPHSSVSSRLIYFPDESGNPDKNKTYNLLFTKINGGEETPLYDKIFDYYDYSVKNVIGALGLIFNGKTQKMFEGPSGKLEQKFRIAGHLE